eukprot:TRINITY_DN19_c0_g1_i21.p1 TRINITY_DN19_c0_g1~~TRINITY_DN19_c0_g1_i21.p1  ORF type:complete len:580 (-),score=174.23 TRINITY_DN19_c0_g1_i21:96-1835(-)
MCTIIRQQAASLAYLEQVRQHLARLPSIDPSTRTIIITGYPNVGKSSIMNKLTNANVDVQPYAFTTKSLYVGHLDYNYLRWQVIDSPGILDHPLEDRNTIEMQAITALAHLRAAVLFMLDISAQCGYTIKQQVALFQSLKPLFANKPVVLALNKVDAVKYEDVDAEDRALLEGLVAGHELPSGELPVVQCSALTDVGVADVKQKICDMLLAQRTEAKLQGKGSQAGVISRLHLAMPKPRDTTERPAFIPESVIEARAAGAVKATLRKKKQEKELKKAMTELALDDGMEREQPGQDNAGEESEKTMAEKERKQEEEDLELYKQGILPWMDRTKDREEYLLENPHWKYDVVPEIMDGKNIADFVDRDIWEKLEELEKEEEIREQKEEEEKQNDDWEPLTEEQLTQLGDIREKKVMIRLLNTKKNAEERRRYLNRTTAGERSTDDFAAHLENLGVDTEEARTTSRSAARSASRARSLSRVGRKREREASEETKENERKRRRSMSKSELRHERRDLRERSNTPGPGTGFRDAKQKFLAARIQKKGIWQRNKEARAGEGDRHIPSLMPKHLFSGKRKAGKTQRR